jgi:ferric-dicitrate binding protein FerR (iron transport regulator)
MDRLRIEAYVLDQLSPHARRAIELWAQEDPVRLRLLDAHRRVQEARAVRKHQEPRWDVARMIDGVRRRVVMLPAQETRMSREIEQGRSAGKKFFARSVRRFTPWIGGISVVLLLALSIRGRGSSSAPVVYTTQMAEQRTIHLADGTRVVLAPQSQLTVSTDFDATTRTVFLLGEAYFDISRSSGRPFMVQTGRVSTRVLGTTFDIRHYRGDVSVQIVVKSGKVMVQGRGAPFTVSSGKVVSVSDSITVVKTLGDSNSYADWTTGRLVFERTPLPVMLTTLGRWYGYEFRLQDSVLISRNVSAEFKVSDPAEMMSVLKSMLGVTLTFHGNVITLTRQHEIRRARPRLDVFTPSLEIGK